MSDRKLVVSFGGLHPAKIVRVERLPWEVIAPIFLQQAPERSDKAAEGWYAFAEFEPEYRDSDKLIARHALTFDFDHVTHDDVKHIRATYAGLEYVLYTTASHTQEKPRLRMLLPLSRPAGYDEFQAVSRKVAARAGIELCAREAQVPAQMMYMPTVKPGQKFKATRNVGAWVDVDAVLGEYDDWTDRAQWPKRADGDGVHSIEGVQQPPDEKQGIVGDWCRAIDVYQAIERFHLPYEPTTSEGRLTYTGGSRPEGAIVYDRGQKLHSHHDTDPARGQTNSFDLVRAHKYSNLDTAEDLLLPVTERPSYRAMCRLALEQPEVRASQVDAEFEDLGPLTADEATGSVDVSFELWSQSPRDLLDNPSTPRWLIPDVLERSVIALLVGPRGSYKSFLALMWAIAVAVKGDWVYVISAEGMDFDRRLKAYMRTFYPNKKIEDLPLRVAQKRPDLTNAQNLEHLRKECVHLKIKPALFVFDTYSKLTGSLDENSNTDVKAWLGMLDRALKRPPPDAFDATVLLIAHVGLSDATRARGASAFAADTDSEFVITRDDRSNTMSVTRERFKSSAELPPLCFRPEVIDLGYQDANGKPVTSLILREATPEETERGREPAGAKAKAMWRVLQDLAPDGQPIAVKAVLDVAVEAEAAPEEGERDRRREKSRIRLENLAAAGFVYFSDAGTMVALSRTKVIPNSEFADVDSYLE